jgi:hypothetical protein
MVWRLLNRLGEAELGRVAAARAVARETVWAQRRDRRCRGAAGLGGRDRPAGLVIDVDANDPGVSQREGSRRGDVQSHLRVPPVAGVCDNSGEFLAGILRPGSAGANTAADHITVLDPALAEIPDPHRHGSPLLVRADGAGCTKAFLSHIRDLRQQHVAIEFSVGWAVSHRERLAIDTLPAITWTPAIDADGEPREGADVAGLTTLPSSTLDGYPTGSRILVRRERPHPGAQLSAFEDRDGWRYQCLATDTTVGQLAFLDVRHRAHARVEDRIRCGKDTGLGLFPGRRFATNTAWLSVVMLAVDLTTWA